MACHPVAFDGYGIVVHRLTVRIYDLYGDVCRLTLITVYKLGTDTDESVIVRGDIEWMPGKVHVLRGADETDVTEQTSTCVPA